MIAFTKYCFPLIIIVVQTGCSTFKTLETKKKSALEDPSFWDIGAGFAQLQNTDSKDDNDARGLMISFKAYPWGRWYSTEKPKVLLSVDKENKNVDALKILVANKKAAGTEMPDKGESSIWLQLDKDTRMISTGTPYIYCPESGKCRDNWYHRISVFYGLSSKNFIGGDVDSNVHAIGLGYDITPELALITGLGFFDLKKNDNSRSDSDAAFLFGVSLNLRAVGAMFKAAGN